MIGPKRQRGAASKAMPRCYCTLLCYAAFAVAASVGTDAIVFRICEAIW
jgi:hypothetical protein